MRREIRNGWEPPASRCHAEDRFPGHGGLCASCSWRNETRVRPCFGAVRVIFLSTRLTGSAASALTSRTDEGGGRAICLRSSPGLWAAVQRDAVVGKRQQLRRRQQQQQQQVGSVARPEGVPGSVPASVCGARARTRRADPVPVGQRGSGGRAGLPSGLSATVGRCAGARCDHPPEPCVRRGASVTPGPERSETSARDHGRDNEVPQRSGRTSPTGSRGSAEAQRAVPKSWVQ
jgi:hypothetical protein